MNRTILIATLLLPTFAMATPITDYALYSGNKTQINNGVQVNSGKVGSAGNVTLYGESHVVGSVNSGGTIALNPYAAIDGNAVASDKVTLDQGARIGGSVAAGHGPTGVAVSVGRDATVVGSITHLAATTVTHGVNGTYGPDLKGTPAPFIAPTTPAPTSFAAGGNDITTVQYVTTKLAAGSYNKVQFGAHNTVNLSAGTYYFNLLSADGYNTFNIDLSGGAVSLFITGNVNFGANLDINLMHGDASDIYAETKGNWSQAGSGEWFGTVFASGASSDIDFGADSRLTGSFIANHNLTIAGGTSTVNLMAADRLTNAVPEPSSFLLAAIALAAFALSRKRQA